MVSQTSSQSVDHAVLEGDEPPQKFAMLAISPVSLRC
eukprot:SAG31_NODE_20803_length_565_cov_0.727468_1_plen_36_part_01